MNLPSIEIATGLSAIARRARSGRTGIQRIGSLPTFTTVAEAVACYQQAATLAPGQTLFITPATGVATITPGGARVIVSGSLSVSDLTGNLQIAGVDPFGSGTPYYTIGGIPVLNLPSRDYFGPLIIRNVTNTEWHLYQYGTGEFNNTGSSAYYASTSDTATPLTATGWNGVNGATGTPVFTAGTATTTPTLLTTSAQDFEGRDFPSSSNIRALALANTGGTAELWGALAGMSFELPLSNGSTQNFHFPGGVAGAATLTIFNSSDTSTRVTVTVAF